MPVKSEYGYSLSQKY